MSVTIDQVIEAYVSTRNEIKSLEDKIKELKEFQARKEEYFLKKMAEDGTESMRSKHGTVYQTLFESVTVADRDVFIQYVKDNDAFNLLENRVSKTEALHIMGDREESGRPNPPPAGCNYVAIKKIGVRRG